MSEQSVVEILRFVAVMLVPLWVAAWWNEIKPTRREPPTPKPEALTTTLGHVPNQPQGDESER